MMGVIEERCFMDIVLLFQGFCIIVSSERCNRIIWQYSFQMGSGMVGGGRIVMLGSTDNGCID